MAKINIKDDLTIANTIIFQQLNLKNETACDKRLAQQKIYLLQLLDNDLGYTFVWSPQDVYSDELEYILDTTYEPAIKTDYSSHKLALHVRASINKVKLLTDGCRPDSFSEPMWQNLLVTIAHIHHNPIRWQTEPTKKEILDKLKNDLGQLTNDRLLNYAWECLARYDFISNRPPKTKRLIKEIR